MTIEIQIFVTPTCPSCQPVFDETYRVVNEIKKEIGASIEVKKIDVTEKGNLKMALKYNVKTVPTIVIGSKDIIKGVPDRDELLEMVKRHM
ncbi:thioredoxin [archaeon]|nr:thioredoxin [archaeon]